MMRHLALASCVEMSIPVPLGFASGCDAAVSALSRVPFGLLCFVGCVLLVSSAGAQPLSFTDITASAGTGGPTARHEVGGHGAAWADVNDDGLPDLYITMIYDAPQYRDLFFRNIDGARFATEAEPRGLSDLDGGSHGAAWADLDNDGDYDLVNGATVCIGCEINVPGNGDRNDLYENNGAGLFHRRTPKNMSNRREATRGVIAFDMDQDGDLDLYCVSGWKGSSDPPSDRNEFYRNDGDFRFVEILDSPLHTAPAGQSATDTDFDGDGDIDVIACNRDGDLNVFCNRGRGDFSVVDPATLGITHRAYSGVTTGDIDNDGDLDLLLVTGDDRGELYVNDGDGTFTHRQSFPRVDGFMGGFADLDLDSDVDLVFAGYRQVLLNDGMGNFSGGPPLPIAGIDDPRSVSFADIDRDGDVDFAFGVKRSRNWLVRNDYHGNHSWLRVKLVAPNGQAGAFGAKVFVYPAGAGNDRLLGLREAKSNYGYLGQDDPVLHFGLGEHESVDLLVSFPLGVQVTRSNVAANQTIVIDGRVGAGPQTN